MPCYHPVSGFMRSGGGYTPARSKSPTQAPLTVPCGRCIGCRLDRSREWGGRIAMEASLHEENSFLTLTYADEFLPKDYGVHIEHLQKFFKRVRKHFEPKRLRYVACGEYGDETLRPHYHVILFGEDFASDRTLWRRSPRGDLLYRSATLERLWPCGNSEIGNVTKESGDYVARYVLKKIGGAMAEEHYRRVHPLTKAVSDVSPEFLVMSSRPGIGREWFDKFQSDVFPGDFVVVNGTRMPVPRYFMKQIEEEGDPNRLIDQNQANVIKRRRKLTARSRADDSTPERLEVREKCREARLASLKRQL